MQEDISILGCGWMGLPLAQALKKSGYFVKGSRTSMNGIEELEKNGVKGYKIEVKENIIEGNLDDFFANTSVAILSLPPGLRKDPNSNFHNKIRLLSEAIETANVAKVIFISSTSVYNNDYKFPSYNEESALNPNTEVGRQLVQCENLLMQNQFFKTTVIRFGGLIGEDRHPAKMLSGKTNVNNPKSPVNLIHRNDCIQLIKKIIEGNHFGYILNAVNPEHPTKEDYYTTICKQFGIPSPSFDHSNGNIGKVIVSKNIGNVSGFKFETPIY